MPKGDRSERKKSRRSRRAEAEQAELVAAADEEEGTVIASGGEDDAQNLRARRVAILGVSVRERALCAEDPNFCTSDDIPLNASVIALRRWENAQEVQRERRRRR